MVKKTTKTSGRVTGTLSNPTYSRKISKAKESHFGYLNLRKLGVNSEIGQTKVRTHANPLSIQYSLPIEKPNWSTIFSNPLKELMVDIGCGPGRFSLAAAQSEEWKDCNHLGIEIRQPLVKRANTWAKKLNLGNCYYISTNVNVSLFEILNSYPGKISVVAIQFPDPHFKKKHQKRRVLTKDLIETVAEFIKENSGLLFIQSDVEGVVSQMRDRIALSQYFTKIGSYSPRDNALNVELNAYGDTYNLWSNDGNRKGGGDFGDWLTTGNPLRILTERESQNLALGDPIYRAVFTRNDKKFILSDDMKLNRVMETVKTATRILKSIKAKEKAIFEELKCSFPHTEILTGLIEKFTSFSTEHGVHDIQILNKELTAYSQLIQKIEHEDTKLSFMYSLVPRASKQMKEDFVRYFNK